MKRVLNRVIFTCIIIGFLTSGTIHKDPGSVFHRFSLVEINNDTTDYTSFIQADSFNLTILKPSSGVQFYKDGIVFLSLSKNEEKITPNHISFGTVEAYYATPEDSTLGKHVVFSPWSSFSFPCEGISFSPDYKTMYFTRIPKKESKEKIYKASFTSEGRNEPGWVSEINPLDFCTDNYNYSHPAITADENVMIFASDKEGSLGGMDLFITRKFENTWSVPQNLGKSINTPGNEFFPFLDSDNNLYFSSDGLSGYGGYDIFTCRFNGKVWDDPINLSDHINSENDDIAFTINKTDGRSAFYTRREKTGKGAMQLFRVRLTRESDGINLLTFSYIFHGKSMSQNNLLAVDQVPQVLTVKEEPLKEKPVKATQKALVSEKKTPPVQVKVKRAPRQKKREIVIVASASAPPTPEIFSWKAPALRKMTITPVIKKNYAELVYRVQFLSSKTSKGNFQVPVNNKLYNTFEYFYLKEYRYTIGEFSTLASAKEFQNACRKDGKPQVFVVAFINNVRSLDPALF